MTFAECLRQLRDRAGLTQEQLADRSGVNVWTIRGYEQGRREPNWRVALDLAAALGVTAEAFAGCEESPAADQKEAGPKGQPRKPPAAAQDERPAGGAPRRPPGRKKPPAGKGKGKKGKGAS